MAAKRWTMDLKDLRTLKPTPVSKWRPVPVVAVLGGRDGFHIGAGVIEIADVEGRHFLAPRFRLTARPPSFIDVDPKVAR
jgi:hypothetical protein